MNIENFESEWGAPYGEELFKIPVGNKLEIDIIGNTISIAYHDSKNGGQLEVFIDGEKKLVQDTNVPFVDSTGKEHFIENRRAIAGLEPGTHHVELKAKNAEVAILGVYEYQTQSDNK